MSTDHQVENLVEGWGDFVDPTERFFDDPSFLPANAGYQSPYMADREPGTLNLPSLITTLDLRLARGLGRLLADTTAAGQAVIVNLQNYIVHTGFKYTFAPRNKQEVSPDLLQQLQDIGDDFREENCWDGDLDRELVRRDVRDGEYFLSSYQSIDGRLLTRVIEPEFIVDPVGISEDAILNGLHPFKRALWPTRAYDWDYGVMRDAEDKSVIYGYFVQWENRPEDFDWFPASMVQHSKGSNVDRNIARGLSDFFAVHKAMNNAGRLQDNALRGAQVQAAIAYIMHAAPGANPAGASSIQSANTTYQYQQNTPQGSKTRSVEQIKPGTVIRAPAGQVYEPGPLGSSHGPNFELLGQWAARSVGARWAMPEYMISGDASNNNMASALVAEAPFVKNCEARQFSYARMWKQLHWRAVQAAINCGRLDVGMSFPELKRLVDIQVEPPEVATRDPLQQEQVRDYQSNAGILSKRTRSAQSGLDHDQEQANIATEPKPEPDESVSDKTESLAPWMERWRGYP